MILFYDFFSGQIISLEVGQSGSFTSNINQRMPAGRDQQSTEITTSVLGKKKRNKKTAMLFSTQCLS